MRSLQAVESKFPAPYVKSERSSQQALVFSLTVDGRLLAPTGFDSSYDHPTVKDPAKNFFVRIHPIIAGESKPNGIEDQFRDSLFRDRRFVLKSITPEEGGVARLHYISSSKKQAGKS
jgi:hypothetical protein